MATLKIRKVTSLPGVLEPSCMYFLVNNNKLIVYVTDSGGSVVYNTLTDGDASSLALAMINTLKGQPNGLASLDSNGDLIETAINVEAQNLLLQSGGIEVWKTLNIPGTNLITANLTQRNAGNYIYLRSFRPDSSRSLYCSVNLPHDYKEGTDFKIRMNLLPIPNNNLDVVNPGSALFYLHLKKSPGMGTSIIGPVNYNSILANFAGFTGYDNATPDSFESSLISGTGLTPNSTIFFRIYSIVNNPQYTFNRYVGVISLDVCYKTDKFGTRNLAPNFYI